MPNVKVKIFGPLDNTSLEIDMNKWLDESPTIEVIDIKYSCTHNEHTYNSNSALILYTTGYTFPNTKTQ